MVIPVYTNQNFMTAKSLFNIILKVLGIYFIKDIIIAIPTVIGVLYELGNSDVSGAFTSFLFSAATLFIYSLIAYHLIFKTDSIIERLKLLDKLPEDPIPLNIHSSTVLSITILVVGLLSITQGIPLVIRELSNWYQYNKSMRSMLNSAQSFNYSMILVYVAEIIIGLLLIGNQRTIVNYIELKQRRS
jgi:magnesium-transporting ATPase (P-type)